ncbi:alpha-galactosidase [Paenibacillus sp. MWE-103]|uniref:Alpha-galactosidase n=1 Tax=Paenibacillus artemisiicola TaxID=1172618 RepID=A0ABS3WJ31_9BACL|nr:MULTISPECIES: alpha-galactosidase [Paenibacillus]MBO7748341.1 alpha-galactosidase [Paenibacillus artemisiicola]SFI79928.1 alpha-galactosidase [Paenibacillus sp. UNC496MF]
MTKVAIIGAGSFFTEKLVIDMLNIEGLEEGEFALVDLDAERLEIARKLTERVVQLMGKRFKVSASVNRRDVIAGSRFVINQIEVAGLQTVRNEFEIPLKYGVKQCIGDTMGPGGLFKILRTVPAWLDILKDIGELCPDAQILNYTNPMSAVTLATVKSADIPVVGLCHSIQNTSRQLADYLDVPYGELKWRAGGINHMSWFVELSRDGKDLYPGLKAKAETPELLAKDPVRLDFMKYAGAFVSESSGHFSEYLPYYRKRQDLIDLHCGEGYLGGTGFYASNWPNRRSRLDEELLAKVEGTRELSLESSSEYAAVIIEGMLKNEPKIIYGNVPNGGLIDNLPADGIVEVACLVDRNGVQPTAFGRLPEHLAALCRSNMAFFDLAVNAVLENSREMAYHALLIDPLSAAVCSPAEIKSMFDELYEADKPYIPDLR